MIALCIHDFPVDRCAACRKCSHGLMASRCTRCRATATSRARRTTIPDPRPSVHHAGYEIFFDPAVNGWLFRAADTPASSQSYRSAFLARKAIDRLADEPPSPSAARSKPAAKRRR